MDRARVVNRRARLALLASVVLATRAHAEPCDPALGRPFTGPIELGLREAGLGAPRSPCAAREVFARVDGGATVDRPEFYGTIAGALHVGVRWPVALEDRLELSAEAWLADWRFAQNASIKATELTYGPLAVGVHWQLPEFRALGTPVSYANTVRVVLPGTRIGVEGDRGALEYGAHVGLRPRRWLSLGLHGGGLTQLTEAEDGGTSSHWQFFVGSSAGLAPADWFALIVGLELADEWHGQDRDHLLVRGGLRFFVGRAGIVELGAGLPFGGVERTDLIVQLGWRHGL